jgi:hypothetical protein
MVVRERDIDRERERERELTAVRVQRPVERDVVAESVVLARDRDGVVSDGLCLEGEIVRE